MSYGSSDTEVWLVHGPQIVDKILKGAKPAEMPFQQLTRFELAINLRTARTLGLVLPPALLLRADHVLDTGADAAPGGRLTRP